MSMLSGRVLLRAAAGDPLIAAGAGSGLTTPSTAGLKSLTAEANPISAHERSARIAKVQTLMRERKVAALLIEPASTLHYFTGIRWRRSEGITLAVIPGRGGVVVRTPAF